MKTSSDNIRIPLVSCLPFILLLIFSTVFNASLTWNDFQALVLVQKAQENKYISEKHEAPLRLEQVAQLVDADGHYGMSNDNDWDSLLPSNHATGIHVNSSETGQFISVYHQISCLNTLRHLYMNPGWENDQEKQNRAHHCLNIIRQAVLCNADTTLEPSHSEQHSNGNVVAAASGMDVLHVCRNWEQLLILSEKDEFLGNHNNI